MCRRIAELGQSGFAITDHGNMNGFAAIQKAAKAAGVKVLAGVEFYVAIRGISDKSERDTAHLTVWAADLQGYRNLCKLQTRSFVDGFYFDPRVDLELLAEHSAGLMASSGCLGGMACKALNAGDAPEADRRVKELAQIFDGRFWIEMQNHEIEEELALHAPLEKLAKKYDLPIVATADSHYTEKGDWIPHDIVVCLGKGQTRDEAGRKVVYKPEEFALKSADEMLARHKAAHVWESGRIFDMCESPNIGSKTFHIPSIEVPADYFKNAPPKAERTPDSDLQSYFICEVQKGLIRRYGTPLSPGVAQRSLYETNAIIDAGFVPYLLLVADIYKFAESRNIPTGVGRGSSAGSIVCYALGITGVDPLEHDLMFERFIDPNRVSQPDVDCDFSARRRPEIIQYLKERWGDDCVSQIVTFQTMGGRAAPRDVARALGKSIDLGEKIAKLIPEEGSVTRDREERESIASALESVKKLRELYDTDPDVREVVDLSMQLEGTLKATSLHAAGIVIADAPLGTYCPMITTKGDGEERLMATGYGMDDLEAVGLLKIDLLGIRNLDTIDDAVKAAVADGTLAPDFEVRHMDIHDPAIYRLVASARTMGVFQLESPGMRNLLREFQPDCFDDFATCISIFRPGPIGQIPNLVARKHGREAIEYPHADLEPILRATYGLTIYQEQIIKMAQVVAGFSITRADQLRKVIGKKILEKMPAEKADFIAGAVVQGHDKRWATKLFESVIEPAARYAFSRSHAYSYSDLLARTAWCKTHIPVQFFAALLGSVEDRPERAAKMAEYIADARSFGIAVRPPNVNASTKTFTPIVSERAVAFGLGGIKHVGSKAVDEILAEREARGPFTDVFDFVRRVKSTLVNSRCIESLVACGALDVLPGTRAQKRASLPNAFALADAEAEDRKRLAAGKKPVKRKKELPEATLLDAPEDVGADLAAERDLVGIYISSHPYVAIATAARAAGPSLQEARESPGQTLSVAGIVTRVQTHVTKKNKQSMAFGVIEDTDVTLEFTVFPRTYAQIADLLELGQPVVLTGRIEGEAGEESTAKMIVDSAAPLDLTVREAMAAGTLVKSRPLPKPKVQRPDYLELTADNYKEEIERGAALLRSGKHLSLTFGLPNGEEIRALA